MTAAARSSPVSRATLQRLHAVREEVLTLRETTRVVRRRWAWVLEECEKAERGEPSAFPGARRDAPLRPWRIPAKDVEAFLRR